MLSMENLNQRIRKLDVFDIALTKISVFFFAVLLVKFAPSLARMNWATLIILVVIAAVRPFYTVWIRK